MVDPTRQELTPSQARFVERLVRRERLFLWLSVAGVLVGFGLAAYFLWTRTGETAAGTDGLRFVVVVLILLNARQNLRQVRVARALSRLLGSARC